ncbi:GAF domain-containing protein [Phormidium tenue FACHB-886]|nr:GAF domain-containing protein [Phormidium tenue FACHB-886]
MSEETATSITQYQTRLAILEQENSILRAELEQARLEAKQGQVRYSLRVIAIAAPNAIAPQQEKAAQDRAAELAKANDALRRGVEGLAMSGTLDAALDVFLLEAMSVTGAAAGAVMERGVGSEFIMQALAQDGEVIHPFSTHSSEDIYRERTAADPTGIMRRTAAGEIVLIPVEDIEPWFPEAAAYHRNLGHRMVWHFPFQIGGNVVGYLGLAFREARSPSDVLRETVQALAHQASLALEIKRLAAQATQATVAKLNEVIAREQEKAAQDRAAELAKANDALKRSLTLLADEPSLDKFLGYVLQTIADQLGDRSGAIYLYNETCETTVLHLNYEDRQLQQGHTISHPATSPAPPQCWDAQYLPLLRQNQVLIHQEPEFATPAYDPYRQHNRDRGIKTLLFVPMLFGEQLLGIITLRSTQQHHYKPEELELARALAHQATLAIQLTHLAEQSRQAAVLEERNRFARDMHDTLAQAFTGVLMQLEATKRKINAVQLEAAQEHVARARSLASEGLSEARRSVRALRPEVLESLDLPTALRRLAEQTTADTSIPVLMRIEGIPRTLPIDLETNLLRIGQEALTNALRHAQAQKVRLELLFETDAVHLHIEDDGKGFNTESQPVNGGFGLLGMQERSQRLGGQFTLKSSYGQGTEITVSVPI